MSDETQLESVNDESTPAGGRFDDLLGGPLGVAFAAILAGLVIGLGVFIAVGDTDDDEALPIAARGLDDTYETIAEEAAEGRRTAEFQSIVEGGSPAVTLGDEELSWPELVAMLQQLPSTVESFSGLGSPDVQITGQIVRQWLITQALEEELAAVGVAPTDDDRAGALADTIIADPEFDETTPFGELALATRTITAALDRYVLELAAEVEVELPEYLCSSHILVNTGEEAQEIIRLLGDGADFAELAMERSLDPGSGAAGGDLGCGPTIGFVPEFTQGARETGDGNLSAPVRSQFGWHVIDVRTIGELTIENHPELTEAEITQRLGSFESQAQNQASVELGDEIVSAAWERVDDEHTIDPWIGTWDGARLLVLPPSGS